MNHPLPLPPEMAGFKPYGTGMAAIQSGDGAVFHAALGSIGDDKSTFYVWCWTEHPDGSCALVPIPDPPKNAPSFAVVNGGLRLYGVLDTAIVERNVPGWIPPAVVDQPARTQASAATRMAAAALGAIKGLAAAIGAAVAGYD